MYVRVLVQSCIYSATPRHAILPRPIAWRITHVCLSECVDQGLFRCLKFFYATQQLQFASFLPLELLERDAARLPSHKHDDWEAESFDFAKRTFRLMGIDSVTWYEFPDIDDYYVSVLPACFHETGGLVSSLADPVRLALVLEGLPGKPMTKRKMHDEDELRHVEAKPSSDVPKTFTAWLNEERP